MNAAPTVHASPVMRPLATEHPNERAPEAPILQASLSQPELKYKELSQNVF